MGLGRALGLGMGLGATLGAGRGTALGLGLGVDAFPSAPPTRDVGNRSGRGACLRRAGRDPSTLGNMNSTSPSARAGVEGAGSSCASRACSSSAARSSPTGGGASVWR